MTNPLLKAEWISRLEEYNQLFVGFSGGLDSTVLLHALKIHPSLASKLIAVHIHHGISPNATDWQKHCKDLCLQWNIPFITKAVEFNRDANIEEEARIARYIVFSALLKEQDGLLLGHHLDDQAETVLLQLFRGAGVDGLSAMQEIGPFAGATVLRPLISYPRKHLEHYASVNQLNWIEDESNEDTHYSRNYVRQKVIPLLANKWPGVVGSLARTAVHCQQAQINLNDLAILDYPDLAFAKNTLFIEPLKRLSRERLTNVIRVWLKKNHLHIPSAAVMQCLIEEVIFSKKDATPLIHWEEMEIRRYQNQLHITKKEITTFPQNIEWNHFPEPLFWDNCIILTAHSATKGLAIPPGAQIVVRFRQGGELMHWHGQNKQLKKLFQQWGIPPWLRATIPLVYINEHLAAVVGYAVSDLFYSDKPGSWTLLT